MTYKHLCLSLACTALSLSSCAKDDTQPVAYVPGGLFTETEIRFSVGPQRYTARSVDENGFVPFCTTGIKSNDNWWYKEVFNGGSYDQGLHNWTRYYTDYHRFSIIRMDKASEPSFRLGISGDLDLHNPGPLPRQVSGAQLSLDDFGPFFVPPGSPPDAYAHKAWLTASGDDVSITITAVNGNILEGTFQATLTTPYGLEVKIEKGSFRSELLDY